MKNDIAIEVHQLTKTYHLYDKPEDRFKEALNPFKKIYHHKFHAVNDVSFEVRKGETVGILGKNGAGKSTLLKMITGVLTPTSGTININGKISSLLELGAGFNPEMTGMENIYLNGTLMGLSRIDMDAKVDAILEFADIGEFIHQPVKVYSSGMFARLAFSVAINVEPDILIVDEVLSVGDMRFQQKSIRKMKEFQERGMTILFVSHDTGVTNDFCSRAIWIKDGGIYQEGKSSLVTKNYHSYMAYGETVEISNAPGVESSYIDSQVTIKDLDSYESFGLKDLRIESVSIINQDTNERVSILEGGENVAIRIRTIANKEILSPIIGIECKNKQGNVVFGINNIMYQQGLKPLSKNEVTTYNIIFVFPLLSTGEYSFNVAVAEGTLESHVQHHWIHDLFEVLVVSEPNKKINSILYIKDDNVSISEDI